MASQKISALSALTDLAADDELVVLDKSDTTMAASGTNKRAPRRTISGIGQLAASGLYYGPCTSQMTSAYSSADQMFLCPVMAARDCTLDRLAYGAHNSPGAATMTIYVVVYEEGANGLPSTRLGYYGFPGNYTSWAAIEGIVSLAIQAGRKWLGFVMNGTGTVPTMGAGDPDYPDGPVPNLSVPGGRVLRYDGVTGVPTADLSATSPSWQDIYAPVVYWRAA